MADRIESTPGGSSYGQSARFGTLYANAAKNPVPQSVVANKILEIAESGTWQLRHPVGPDAGQFLSWRRGMKDEDWVDKNAGDDATFFKRLAEA